jgi:hypothetical protein
MLVGVLAVGLFVHASTGAFRVHGQPVDPRMCLLDVGVAPFASLN